MRLTRSKNPSILPFGLIHSLFLLRFLTFLHSFLPSYHLYSSITQSFTQLCPPMESPTAGESGLRAVAMDLQVLKRKKFPSSDLSGDALARKPPRSKFKTASKNPNNEEKRQGVARYFDPKQTKNQKRLFSQHRHESQNHDPFRQLKKPKKGHENGSPLPVEPRH